MCIRDRNTTFSPGVSNGGSLADIEGRLGPTPESEHQPGNDLPRDLVSADRECPQRPGVRWLQVHGPAASGGKGQDNAVPELGWDAEHRDIVEADRNRHALGVEESEGGGDPQISSNAMSELSLVEDDAKYVRTGEA